MIKDYLLLRYPSTCIIDDTFFFYVAALSDPPIFAEPIPNVTVALGRDVSLPCVIENLGSYKVTNFQMSEQRHARSTRSELTASLLSFARTGSPYL